MLFLSGVCSNEHMMRQGLGLGPKRREGDFKVFGEDKELKL